MSLEIYQKDLANIKRVCDKLVTVQNSFVFDKLCIKCENLLNNIAQDHPEEKTAAEREGIIAVLRGLLDVAKTLSAYREYLVSAVRQNLALYEKQGRQNQISQNNSGPVMTQEETMKLTKKFPEQIAA